MEVSPDQSVFIGEKVTLTCDIQTGEDIQWIKYSWSKVPYRTTSAADFRAAKLSFSAVSVSDAGQYSCELQASSDSQRSITSDAVKLTVSGESS